MNDINDTAKLYQLFGGQASDYQELRREQQAQSAKQRWPLLAWLDLSALNVSEPPKVELGETPSGAGNQRVQRSPQPMTAPLRAPTAGISPVAAAVQANTKITATSVGRAIDFNRISPSAAAVAAPDQTPAPAMAPARPTSTAPASPVPAQGFAAFRPSLTEDGPEVAPYLKTLLKPEEPVMTAAHVLPTASLAPVTAPSPVLRDIFTRLAQPAQSQPAPAPQGMPGNIWANLSSKL